MFGFVRACLDVSEMLENILDFYVAPLIPHPPYVMTNIKQNWCKDKSITIQLSYLPFLLCVCVCVSWNYLVTLSNCYFIFSSLVIHSKF